MTDTRKKASMSQVLADIKPYITKVLILSAMRHMKKLCRKMKQKSARWHSSSSSHGSLHSVLL